MIPPMRAFAIGPSAADLTSALRDGPVVDISDEFGSPSSPPTGDCALAAFVPGHSPTPEELEWGDAVFATAPDIIVADVACSTCLSGEPYRHWPGRPRVFAIGHPPLADCLALLPAFGAAVGVEHVAAREFSQRSARLLALRMHVARYLVRTRGTKRPTVLALTYDGDAWQVLDNGRLDELIDAAGGVRVAIPVGQWASLDDIARAQPDVILAGRFGAETADPSVARHVNALSDLSPAVWHADWDTLLQSSGPSIVDAVESMLRATFPQALGRNGTPPPIDVLRRVVTRMDHAR